MVLRSPFSTFARLKYGSHQLLYLAVVVGLISLGAQLLGQLMAEFVTEAPLDSKARFLAKFVTGLVIAVVFGVGYGYLRGRYYRGDR